MQYGDLNIPSIHCFLCFDRKVSLMEDGDGNIHLKNLTLHQANNEEEALNLLFLGDTNRMIAEVGSFFRYTN